MRTTDSSSDPKYKDLVTKKERMKQIVHEQTQAMPNSFMEKEAIKCMIAWELEIKQHPL